MEVINQMNKYTIITLKQKGRSNRSIAKELGINRKTVGRIWNEYEAAQNELQSNQALAKDQQMVLTQIIEGRKPYDSTNRVKKKLTPQVQSRIQEILQDEEEKTKRLGARHKQKLTCSLIHQMLREEGIDIGITTVTNYIKEVKHQKEVFIRQEYDYGQRLEYDFGEVKLIIDDQPRSGSLAVFCSPASGFRWAYLYLKQDQKVFLDSHVRFFEMTGGSWKEVVYDNMRNVVTKFIGRNEKQLNEHLLSLAMYYQYEINVTNCFSGHEKGSVEGSVKFIRNKVFARNYKFESFEQAQEHLQEKLIELNQQSEFQQEKPLLQPCPINYELAEVFSAKVDKYSCVRVENNFYSVPDYLIDKNVTIKNYVSELSIYSHNELVWTHKKVNGVSEYQLELSHYLKTLSRKPGALKNSTVLKQIPELHHIYHLYFKTKPKEFIQICQQYAHQPLDKLIYHLLNPTKHPSDLMEEITLKSMDQLKQISKLYQLEVAHEHH